MVLVKLETSGKVRGSVVGTSDSQWLFDPRGWKEKSQDDPFRVSYGRRVMYEPPVRFVRE